MKLKTTNLNLGILLLSAGMLLLSSCADSQKKEKEPINSQEIKVEGEMVAELTAPPYVPKPTKDRKATKLRVDMEILELEGELVDGVQYMFWTRSEERRVGKESV